MSDCSLSVISRYITSIVTLSYIHSLAVTIKHIMCVRMVREKNGSNRFSNFMSPGSADPVVMNSEETFEGTNKGNTPPCSGYTSN